MDINNMNLDEAHKKLHGMNDSNESYEKKVLGIMVLQTHLLIEIAKNTEFLFSRERDKRNDEFKHQNRY